MLLSLSHLFLCMSDPNWDYTRDEIKKNLILLENHFKNNQCADCVEKHLMTIEGLAEEGTLMTEEEDKQVALLKLAEWSRTMRKNLVNQVV